MEQDSTEIESPSLSVATLLRAITLIAGTSNPRIRSSAESALGNSGGSSTDLVVRCYACPHHNNTLPSSATPVISPNPIAITTSPTTGLIDPYIAPTGPNDDSIQWFVITVGRQVGVSAHWADAAPHVLRCPGAVIAHYPSGTAAIEAHRMVEEADAVYVVRA